MATSFSGGRSRNTSLSNTAGDLKSGTLVILTKLLFYLNCNLFRSYFHWIHWNYFFYKIWCYKIDHFLTGTLQINFNFNNNFVSVTMVPDLRSPKGNHKIKMRKGLDSLYMVLNVGIWENCLYLKHKCRWRPLPCNVSLTFSWVSSNTSASNE
jgi:hypothetical protein